ncbi:hypothetical protein J6590_033087 [Homalodisca vitripennis]|nr:hypothetical protein J6590_033087 [Homalodisca vitripennis]
MNKIVNVNIKVFILASLDIVRRHIYQQKDKNGRTGQEHDSTNLLLREYNLRNQVSALLERKSCITIRDKHPPDVSGYAHPPRHRWGSHADMKNWYSPIMMDRFGRGVVMSWRENNIKTEEQGGEGKSRTRFRKRKFGSASACIRVRKNISRRNKCEVE